MQILIVDDNTNKNNWIKEILEHKEVEYREVTYMNEALVEVIDNDYQGLILDMQFPILNDSEVKKSAGVLFLKRIQHRGIQIPVLGNSTIGFSDKIDYQNFKGQICGFHTLESEKTLIEFIKSIEKEQL